MKNCDVTISSGIGHGIDGQQPGHGASFTNFPREAPGGARVFQFAPRALLPIRSQPPSQDADREKHHEFEIRYFSIFLGITIWL